MPFRSGQHRKGSLNKEALKGASSSNVPDCNPRPIKDLQRNDFHYCSILGYCDGIALCTVYQKKLPKSTIIIADYTTAKRSRQPQYSSVSNSRPIKIIKIVTAC